MTSCHLPPAPAAKRRPDHIGRAPAAAVATRFSVVALVFASVAAPGLLGARSGWVHAEEARAEEPRAQEPAPTSEADETRQLESQIEQYPVTEPAVEPTPDAPVSPTAIPEAIESPQRPRIAPSAAPRAPELEPAAGTLRARPIELARLDARQVVQLQQRLRGRGHYLGPIDGIAGPKTRAALAAFAADQYALSRRLLRDGQLTPELVPLVGGSVESSTPAPPPPAPGSPPSP